MPDDDAAQGEGPSSPSSDPNRPPKGEYEFRRFEFMLLLVLLSEDSFADSGGTRLLKALPNMVLIEAAETNRSIHNE